MASGPRAACSPDSRRAEVQLPDGFKSKKKDAEGGTGWIDILTPDGQNISSKGGDDDDEEEAQE